MTLQTDPPDHPIEIPPSRRADALVPSGRAHPGRTGAGTPGRTRSWSRRRGRRLAVSVRIARACAAARRVSTLVAGDAEITEPLQDFPRVSEPPPMCCSPVASASPRSSGWPVPLGRSAPTTASYFGRSRDQMAYSGDLEAAHRPASIEVHVATRELSWTSRRSWNPCDGRPGREPEAVPCATHTAHGRRPPSMDRRGTLPLASCATRRSATAAGTTRSSLCAYPALGIEAGPVECHAAGESRISGRGRHVRLSKGGIAVSAWRESSVSTGSSITATSLQRGRAMPVRRSASASRASADRPARGVITLELS